MEKTIKVSIIVPVYNVEKYIRCCLDSLVNQTMSNIEIICINDGSTDNSLEILEEYAKKDDRIKIINQENKKQGAARNRGIEIAQGEFIGFVDSDDWVDLDYFEKLYTTALEYQSDVAVASVLKHKKNYQKYNVYYKNIMAYIIFQFQHIKIVIGSDFVNKIPANKKRVITDSPFIYKILVLVQN